jgi:hypothetical protein
MTGDTPRQPDRDRWEWPAARMVCQAFQSDEEDWMNGGEQQSLAFAVAFNPADPDAIAAGFDEFRHFLRLLEVLGELLALLPGCDVLEEQK